MGNPMIATLLMILGGALIFLSVAKRDYLNKDAGGVALPVFVGVCLIFGGIFVFFKN